MPDAVWSGYDANIPNGFLLCITCGAYATPKTEAQHVNFHKTFSNLRSEDMSKVSWCDYGNHPFKAGETGSASFEGTEFDDGVPRLTTMDACSEHNPLKVQRDAAKYSLPVEEYKNLTE